MPIINGVDFIKSTNEDIIFNTALFILISDTSMITKVQVLNLGIKDFLKSQENISNKTLITNLYNLRLNQDVQKNQSKKM